MHAANVMDTAFHTLTPDQTIDDAVRQFRDAGKAEGKKIFGMMVTDGDDRLVGMLSMYDILLFIQPKHARIWGEMDDVDPGPLFDTMMARVKHIRVEDIMTTEVMTIPPETHLLVIVDIMVKKHIRRLPVVEREAVVGMVYRSDVFYYLIDQFMD